MKYTTFHEQVFRQSVESALATVRQILDDEKQLAYDCLDHQFEDKFVLTEFCTNTSLAAVWHVLGAVGLRNNATSKTASGNPAKKSTTLRFVSQDTCTFLKKETVLASDQAAGYEKTTTRSGGFFNNQKDSKEAVTVVPRVTEFHWKVGMRYQLVCFTGVDSQATSVVLQERTAESVLITRSSERPWPAERTMHPPLDVDVSWFVQNFQQDDCRFAIDRTAATTPRKNAEVQRAVEAHDRLRLWNEKLQAHWFRLEAQLEKHASPPSRPVGILEPGVTGVMQGLLKEPSFNGKRIRIVEYHPEQQRYKAEPIDPKSGLPLTLSIKADNIQPDAAAPPLSSITDDHVFCPVLPLLDTSESKEGNSKVLSMTDAAALLEEQSRGLEQAMDALVGVYPPKTLVTKIVSVAEATLVLLCQHLGTICRQYVASLAAMQDMLRKQLVAAIGKEVQPGDLEEFMTFHYTRLYGASYAPQPFCRPIGRPGRYPDGLVALEMLPNNQNDQAAKQNHGPIQTWTRSLTGGPAIQVPIDAATSVKLTGSVHLHGWMQHRYKSNSSAQATYQLACRARQFCSFLVILGTVSGPDKLEPKDAIVLQSKDEVLIPLLTNVLPSAKEFKDAIQSLSPQQKEFATAFRGMQLESSVFGVCVVQLKPQLEKLLDLPDGALVKEIQLTNDLMSLFVDYQVPSDLLTYEGDSESTQADKVASVKGHVTSVLDVIEASKKQQLKEETMKADMRAEQGFCSSDVDEEIAPELMMCARSEVLPAPPPKPTIKKMLRRSMHKSRGSPAAGLPPADSRLRMSQFQSSGNFGGQSDSSPMNKPGSRGEGSSPRMSNLDNGQAPIDLTSLGEDFTLIPKILDSKLEKYDTSNALRSTTIKSGTPWSRTRQENFLSTPKEGIVSPDDIRSERKKAFDLLDAVSRSGSLPIACSEIHVFVCVSHCFDNDVMGTVIEDNINPIAKVEQSSLILASTVHGRPIQQLVTNAENIERIKATFPELVAGFGAIEN